MKLGRLNHIGVATPSIADSIVFYRDVMGATKIHDPFDLPDQGVKVCFVDTPTTGGSMDGTQIELIEPLPGNASIAAFLQKNPAGGQHHVCYEVPDIHAAKAEFEALGKRVLGEPRIGAHGTLIFFVHPKDMGGVLTEIMEVPRTAIVDQHSFPFVSSEDETPIRRARRIGLSSTLEANGYEGIFVYEIRNHPPRSCGQYRDHHPLPSRAAERDGAADGG